MHTPARRPSALPAALATALLTALFAFAAPSGASAHDSLAQSDPAAGSSVETLPAQLTLTFSAKLLDGSGATEVVVTDADGDSVTDGAPTVDGAIVTQPLDRDADAGAYKVVWRVVSSDGHPISDEFSFTVATSTATETPSADSTSAPSAEADATAAPTQTETTPPADESAADDAFPRALPWIVLAVVVAAAGAALVAVSVRRQRSSGYPGSDSDDSVAR